MDKRNLAYQAADLFCQQMLIRNGINIKIKKRIPIASGLAGGSADAAAVLQGMNRLFEVGLGIEDLKVLPNFKLREAPLGGRGAVRARAGALATEWRLQIWISF